MKELKSRLLLVFTLMMFVLGWGIWLFIEKILAIPTIPYYPMMPFLFYSIGVGFIYTVFSFDKSNSLKLANLYLLLKIIKMFVFGAVAVYYIFATEVDKKTFAIVYSVYFIAYTAFETFTFHKLEKEIKKNK
jgi:hypothetical protein